MVLLSWLKLGFFFLHRESLAFPLLYPPFFSLAAWMVFKWNFQDGRPHHIDAEESKSGVLPQQQEVDPRPELTYNQNSQVDPREWAVRQRTEEGAQGAGSEHGDERQVLQSGLGRMDSSWGRLRDPYTQAGMNNEHQGAGSREPGGPSAEQEQKMNPAYIHHQAESQGGMYQPAYRPDEPAERVSATESGAGQSGGKTLHRVRPYPDSPPQIQSKADARSGAEAAVDYSSGGAPHQVGRKPGPPAWVQGEPREGVPTTKPTPQPTPSHQLHEDQLKDVAESSRVGTADESAAEIKPYAPQTHYPNAADPGYKYQGEKQPSGIMTEGGYIGSGYNVPNHASPEYNNVPAWYNNNNAKSGYNGRGGNSVLWNRPYYPQPDYQYYDSAPLLSNRYPARHNDYDYYGFEQPGNPCATCGHDSTCWHLLHAWLSDVQHSLLSCMFSSFCCYFTTFTFNACNVTVCF